MRTRRRARDNRCHHVFHSTESPIFPAALDPHPWPAGGLRRERLAPQAAGRRRFVVLRAPAGWGKTTLLAQWRRDLQDSVRPVAWLTLLPAYARDRQALLAHLAAAWRLPPQAGASLASFWNALQPRLAPGATFLVDGLDALGRDAAGALWSDFLRSAPAALRIVMATRGELSADLLRARLHGELAELDTGWLGFTLDDLGGQADLAHVPHAWLAEAVDAGGGWPLAVGLLARDAACGLAPRASLAAHRNDIAQYLRQETWPAVPARLRRFLLGIAALERIEAPLCDAVRGADDSAALLEQCRRRQCFVIAPATGGASWRIAPVFADFLRGQQAAEADTDLHAKVAVAMRHILRRRFDDAHSQLDAVDAQLDARGGARAAADAEALEGLRKLLACRRMSLAFFREDDAQTVLEDCQALLDDFPQAPPWVKLSLYATLLSLHEETGRLDTVDDIVGRAARCGDTEQAMAGRLHTQSAAARCYLLMGRTAQARQGLEARLAEAIEHSPGAIEMRSGIALQLAEVLYETNRLERVGPLLDEYLPHSLHGPRYLQTAGWLTQVRLTRVRAGIEAALRESGRALTHARHYGFKRLALTMQVETMWLARRGGRPDLVRRLAQELALPVSHAPLLPTMPAGVELELRAVGWAQWARARNDLAGAIQLARAWIHHCERIGAVLPALRWHTELVQLQSMRGDLDGAQRTVRHAIRIAAPGRLSRRLLDAPACHALLLERPAIARGLAPEAADFHRELAAACREHAGEPAPAVVHQAEPPVAGPLTRQEADILKLVARGHANREIAHALGHSETAVKWYLQQIFDKLGPRKRRLAVERARRLGLVE